MGLLTHLFSSASTAQSAPAIAEEQKKVSAEPPRESISEKSDVSETLTGRSAATATSAARKEPVATPSRLPSHETSASLQPLLPLVVLPRYGRQSKPLFLSLAGSGGGWRQSDSTHVKDIDTGVVMFQVDYHNDWFGSSSQTLLDPFGNPLFKIVSTGGWSTKVEALPLERPDSPPLFTALERWSFGTRLEIQLVNQASGDRTKIMLDYSNWHAKATVKGEGGILLGEIIRPGFLSNQHKVIVQPQVDASLLIGVALMLIRVLKSLEASRAPPPVPAA